MWRQTLRTSLLALFLFSLTAQAGELVRSVRNKLSAGDLASSEALVEDYKKKTGVDAEYLDAVGWLARGAEMLRQFDRATAYVAELRREIREEKDEWLAPLGAAIEVEGKVRFAQKGRNAALQFLEQEFVKAKAITLRSRIRRTINAISLEGRPAPALALTDYFGPKPEALTSYKGKPVLLFLWAHWCGDCRAQAASLTSIAQKYCPQGLVVLAPTRYYGTGAQNKTVPPAEEKAHMQKVWAESYTGLAEIPVVIDNETMVTYGVAATPTFVLIDRAGSVRWYAPTRLTEAELARRIEAALAAKP
jgi:thiol-disulfide isomerase/thioredoxin